ncbi:MAG: TrgA family protein [Paracoccaceae bacterium]
MPKLIAGLFFAALGFFCGDLVRPLLPEGTQTGLLNVTLAVLGFVSGWRVSGGRAGSGIWSGFGYGLTSSAVILFWGVFLFAGNKALQYSLDKRFKGPMEALKAMIDFGLEYYVLLAAPSIIVAAVVGGIFGGWLTEWVAERWS